MQKSTLFFSIIMPVYNTGKYLVKSIQSILDQSYKNFELIIIDDGSTDNSKDYISRYLSDKRIKFFPKKNSGVSDTRNFGLAVAKGKYVYFVDSDDYCQQDLLFEVNKAAQKENADLLVFGYRDVDERQTIRTRIPHASSTNRLTPELLLTLMELDLLSRVYNKVFRREYLLTHNILYKPTKLGEDYLFVLDAMAEIQTITLIDKSFYDYDVTRAGSAYKKYRADRYSNLQDQFNSLEIVCRRFAASSAVNEIFVLFKLRSLSSLIMNLFRADTPLNDDEKYSEIHRGLSTFSVTMAEILQSKYVSKKIKLKLSVAKLDKKWSFKILAGLYKVKRN
ncbi:MAG: glycosyltransferase [Lactobacillus sp.]|nr:MAG: glycosyltransferase [Lactobacillus sp.]